MSPDEAGSGVVQSTSKKASHIRGRARLVTFLVLLGSTSYAASLAATVPASFVASRAGLPAQVIDVSGTLWNGQAILDGGYELTWRVLPIQSLFHFAIDADWILEGVDTELSGRASLWSNSATSSVEGRAGWGLLKMAVANLEISCDGPIAVALSRVVVSANRQGAAGSLRSGPMTCTDASARPAVLIDLPAMSGTATMDVETSSLVVSTSSAPRTPLADLKVARRVLVATLYPEGARLTKVLPTSGPIVLEYPF